MIVALIMQKSFRVTVFGLWLNKLLFFLIGKLFFFILTLFKIKYYENFIHEEVEILSRDIAKFCF